MRLTLYVFIVACGTDTVVLTGIPEEHSIEHSANEQPLQIDGQTSVGNQYQKPAGIFIDAHHLGNREYSKSRPELLEQFGSLKQSTELPGDNGTEYEFERGSLRVADDQIYMIHIPLPAPSRRTLALQQLGFPPFGDRYLSTHQEYRINNEWGYRRIRLYRVEQESELVNAVEIWRWIPGENAQRR